MHASRLVAHPAWAVALLALAAGPAAAAERPFAPSARPSAETVGPAAAGDPKPFRSFVQSVCESETCVADFGKKANKVRTVEWISCGINTDGGILVLATIVLSGEIGPVAFMGTVSRAASMFGEVAIAEFTQPFAVPTGQVLRVQLVTDGNALASQCIASGTIQ